MAVQRCRVARQAILFQRVEIGLPVLFLVDAEVVQRFPGIDAGGVAVGETQTDGVVADRLQLHDADFALARDQHLLPGAVALHFGGRRIHAQVFRRQYEVLAGVESDFKRT